VAEHGHPCLEAGQLLKDGGDLVGDAPRRSKPKMFLGSLRLAGGSMPSATTTME